MQVCVHLRRSSLVISIRQREGKERISSWRSLNENHLEEKRKKTEQANSKDKMRLRTTLIFWRILKQMRRELLIKVERNEKKKLRSHMSPNHKKIPVFGQSAAVSSSFSRVNLPNARKETYESSYQICICFFTLNLWERWEANSRSKDHQISFFFVVYRQANWLSWISIRIDEWEFEIDYEIMCGASSMDFSHGKINRT